MSCEDLRHVCGKCGFKWPERSAYDELTSEVMQLRDELAAERTRTDSLMEAIAQYYHSTDDIRLKMEMIRAWRKIATVRQSPPSRT